MADSTKPNLTLCPALLATTLFSVRRIGQARDERAPVSLLATAFQAGGAAALSVAGLSGLLATAQTPASHASTHNAGGADAMAIDAAAATGSLRTLGAGAAQACAGNDSRLSNARTPTAHAASHQSAGSDVLALDTLAAPTDITILNVSTTAHGLAPKLPNDATKYLDGTGAWSKPPLANPLGAGSLAAAALQVVDAGTGLSQVAAHTLSLGANAAEFLRGIGVASPVNYLTVTAAAAGNPVLIGAAGTDTNIGISLVPKGNLGVTAPAGSGYSAPGLSVGGSDGFWARAGGYLAFTSNNHEGFEMNPLGFLSVPHNGVWTGFGFSAVGNPGGLDSLISRAAQGVFSLDTSTQGDHLGQLRSKSGTGANTPAGLGTQSPASGLTPYAWAFQQAQDGTPCAYPLFAI
jgi:hypothetical protein